MIRPPRRAVTRFFVPLIDVLILLFCIFLLMPFVSRPDSTDASKKSDDATTAAPSIDSLQKQLDQTRRRIRELERERINLFERYKVQVLEIDQYSGGLYTFDPGESGRKEIQSLTDANRVISRARWQAGKREVCFLFLYPRELSGFPIRAQVEAYRQWFRDVPHVFDNPWSEIN